MNPWTRRKFLASTLFGGVASSVFVPTLFAEDNKSKRPPLPPDPTKADETIFLTWASDPCRSMRVQWMLHATAADPMPSLKLTEAGGSEWKTVEGTRHPFGPTDWFVHRIDIKDLSPGTKYQFQLQNPSDSGAKQTYFFETAPVKLDQPITFASGGDIGIDPKNVLPLHKNAASWNPLFGFVGGDLSYSNGKEVKVELAFYRYWRQEMVTAAGCLIPMIAAIGNHEVIGGFGKKPEDAPFFYALFDGLHDPKKGAFSVLDFGNYLSLIMLDSGHTTPVLAQNEFLTQALESRKNVTHRIVAYHVPGYPSVRNFNESISIDVRKHWVPILEKACIPVALEHHDHAFKRTKPLVGGEEKKGGVTYLGDGSWGREARKQKPLDEMPWMQTCSASLHVIQVTLSNDKASYRMVNEKNEQLDAFDIPANRS